MLENVVLLSSLIFKAFMTGWFLLLLFFMLFREIKTKPEGLLGRFVRHNGRFMLNVASLFLGITVPVVAYNMYGLYSLSIVIGVAILTPFWSPLLIRLLNQEELVYFVLILILEIIVLTEFWLSEDNFSSFLLLVELVIGGGILFLIWLVSQKPKKKIDTETD